MKLTDLFKKKEKDCCNIKVIDLDKQENDKQINQKSNENKN